MLLLLVQSILNYFVFVTVSLRDSSLTLKAEVVIMEKKNAQLNLDSSSQQFVSIHDVKDFAQFLNQKDILVALSRVVPFIVLHHTRSQL